MTLSRALWKNETHGNQFSLRIGYKTGNAHHLNALRAGVQVGNQFSLRIGYKKTGNAHHLNALRAGVQVGNQFSLRIGYKI